MPGHQHLRPYRRKDSNKQQRNSSCLCSDASNPARQLIGQRTDPSGTFGVHVCEQELSKRQSGRPERTSSFGLSPQARREGFSIEKGWGDLSMCAGVFARLLFPNTSLSLCSLALFSKTEIQPVQAVGILQLVYASCRAKVALRYCLGLHLARYNGHLLRAVFSAFKVLWVAQTSSS